MAASFSFILRRFGLPDKPEPRMRLVDMGAAPAMWAAGAARLAGAMG
jgi:hypothetical protein